MGMEYSIITKIIRGILFIVGFCFFVGIAFNMFFIDGTSGGSIVGFLCLGGIAVIIFAYWDTRGGQW